MTTIIPDDPCQPITDDMRAQLRQRWPNPERILWAIRLAKDADTCAQLIQGQPVDPARIHKEDLREATQATLVQLVAPIDLFRDE